MASMLDPRVEPLARPSGVNEYGERVRPHKFMGTTFVKEMRYFVCSNPVASMHRPDGKKLAFVGGVFATNIQQDINYIEAEIEDGHPMIRPASEAEVHSFRMRIDPRGTMEEELRPKLEAEIRASLEVEIRAKLLAEMANKPDDVKIAEVDGATTADKVITDGGGTKVILTPKTIEPTAEERLAALLVAKQRAPLTPVSTADMAKGMMES